MITSFDLVDVQNVKRNNVTIFYNLFNRSCFRSSSYSFLEYYVVFDHTIRGTDFDVIALKDFLFCFFLSFLSGQSGRN